jgi:hypothetical protein
MTVTVRHSVLMELQRIPSVGEKAAGDLASLGIHSVKDLRKKDPDQMFLQLCALKGQHVDKCMLYVLRCAVYYASHRKHDPRLLKWWNWKEKPKKAAKKKSKTSRKATKKRK